jgi:hypothetical protein
MVPPIDNLQTLYNLGWNPKESTVVVESYVGVPVCVCVRYSRDGDPRGSVKLQPARKGQELLVHPSQPKMGTGCPRYRNCTSRMLILNWKKFKINLKFVEVS